MIVNEEDAAIEAAQVLAEQIVLSIDDGTPSIVAHMALALALGAGIKMNCEPATLDHNIAILCNIIRVTAHSPKTVSRQ